MSTKIPSNKILIREIIFVLLIKLVLLFVIWNSFFDHGSAPITANAIADKLISNSSIQGDTL